MRRPHVVPARRLLPDHQAKLVAGIEEVRGLRVVGAAHHVAVEVVLEDLRIPALQSRGIAMPAYGNSWCLLRPKICEQLPLR